jgi:hypothetical protein
MTVAAVSYATIQRGTTASNAVFSPMAKNGMPHAMASPGLIVWVVFAPKELGCTSLGP